MLREIREIVNGRIQSITVCNLRGDVTEGPKTAEVCDWLRHRMIHETSRISLSQQGTFALFSTSCEIAACRHAVDRYRNVSLLRSSGYSSFEWLKLSSERGGDCMSVGTTTILDHNLPWSPDVPQLRRDACCGHEVQFYSRDEYLLESVVAFIGPSLKSGGSAIVVGTKAHRDGVVQRLEAGGVGLAEAVEQGRYIARDAAECLAAFMIDGMPDRDRFIEVIG